MNVVNCQVRLKSCLEYVSVCYVVCVDYEIVSLEPASLCYNYALMIELCDIK